jgi:hypothetical protein
MIICYRNIQQILHMYPDLNQSMINRDIYLQEYQTNTSLRSLLFNETLMGKKFWFCDLKDDLNKVPFNIKQYVC